MKIDADCRFPTQEWRLYAACADLPPDEADRIFFDLAVPNQALAICIDCPVADECRDFATKNAIPYGVWGCETATERRRRVGINLAGDRVRAAA